MSHEPGRPFGGKSSQSGKTAGAPERAGTSPAWRGRQRDRTDPNIGAFVFGRLRSEMCGRDAELARMRELLTHAVEFQAPQLITVVGNQGTGKTRLVADLVERHVRPPVRVYHGAAEQGGPRYGAITSLLCDRFDLEASDAVADVRQRISSEVRLVFGDHKIDEVLHYLGGFLDIDFPASFFLRVLKEDREQHDAIAKTVLARYLEADAAQSPLVLVFDDMQWADDDTLSLVRELGASLSGSPVAIIACTRPDMLIRLPEWASASTLDNDHDHERIELRNLGPKDAETMLRNLLFRCQEVPAEVIEDAYQMTGGNPHFIEQLVRLYLANGTIDAGGPVWYLSADKAAHTELPISIEEAIEARIAALGQSERDVLEKGAVFGNVFWMSAVVALSRIDSELAREKQGGETALPGDLEYTWTDTNDPTRGRVTAMIAELVDRDYLLQLDAADSTVPGDLELVFKHNLERELIVKSTDVERLARFCRLAAQWLETKLAGRTEEQLEFLGQLYERGGDGRRAAQYYLAGADRARARYANQEAVTLYTRGLAIAEDENIQERTAALHNLGDVLELIGETKEALAKFRTMLHLSWLFDDQAKAGTAHDRLGRIFSRLGQYDLAMRHLREAHTLFIRAGDQRGMAQVLDDTGNVHWLRGTYAAALDSYQQALAIRRSLGDQRDMALSLANIGRLHRDAGNTRLALTQLTEALTVRRSAADQRGVVRSLCDIGSVHVQDGSYDTAVPLFGEAHQIATEIGDKPGQAHVLAELGLCESAMGQGTKAVQHVRAAIELAANLGDRLSLVDYYCHLAEVHLHLREVEHARDNAERALRMGESMGVRMQMGKAHRLLAESLVAKGISAETQKQAEEHFAKAIDTLSAIRSERELARACRAFAGFRELSGARAEAESLRGRADEIERRLRGA